MAQEVPKRFTKLLTWTFEGSRFDDHGVDLGDLANLVSLRRLLLDSAEELWRRENPHRQRLPKNFEERVQLKIFELEPGSAKAAVYAHVDEVDPQGGLPNVADAAEIRPKLIEAARLVASAVRSAQRNEPLPDKLPLSLLGRLQELRTGLRNGEAIGISVGGRAPSLFTAEAETRIASTQKAQWDDLVDVVGEVTAASVKGQATILVDDAPVEIRFTPEQEKTITLALHEHDRVRLRIGGRGTFEPSSGKLRRVSQVDALERVDGTERPYDDDARPVWELVAAISATVPLKEWAKLPRDLAENHDHHLYAPQRRRRPARGSR